MFYFNDDKKVQITFKIPQKHKSLLEELSKKQNLNNTQMLIVLIEKEFFKNEISNIINENFLTKKKDEEFQRVFIWQPKSDEYKTHQELRDILLNEIFYKFEFEYSKGNPKVFIDDLRTTKFILK